MRQTIQVVPGYIGTSFVKLTAQGLCSPTIPTGNSEPKWPQGDPIPI